MATQDFRTAAAAAVFVSAILSIQGLHAEGAVTLGQYGSWSLLGNDAAPRTVCFVASTPKDTEPKGLNREPAYFYISAWPRDGIKSEVSLKLGYKAKKGADAILIVEGTSYKLSARDDRLFVDDATRELKLIEALRHSEEAKLAATSERGTQILDVFSLSGLSEALKALATTCK